jgi:hypothetical protein
MKIRCQTLFDITQTPYSNRRGMLEAEPDQDAVKQRMQQANFETILQIISMRSQPENISSPTVVPTKLGPESPWGNAYRSKKAIPSWQFEFTVNYKQVFAQNDQKLGALLQDCRGVPMIKDLGEWPLIETTLNTSPELRNIVFEIVDEQTQF